MVDSRDPLAVCAAQNVLNAMACSPHPSTEHKRVLMMPPGQ